MRSMIPTADAARSPRPVLLRRNVRWMLPALMLACALHAQAAPLPPTPAQTEGPFYPRTLPADRDADLIAIAGTRRAGAGNRALFRRTRADAGRPSHRRRDRRALAGRPVRPLPPCRRRRRAARRQFPGLWRRDDGRGRALRVQDDPPGGLRRAAAAPASQGARRGTPAADHADLHRGRSHRRRFRARELAQGNGGAAVDGAGPCSTGASPAHWPGASTSCCSERRVERGAGDGRQWIVALEKKRSSAPDFSR